MIDDMLDETVDSFFSDLGIDAEDLGLDANDLREIFNSEFEIPEALSDDEFESVLQAIARSQSGLEDISASSPRSIITWTTLKVIRNGWKAFWQNSKGFIVNLKSVSDSTQVMMASATRSRPVRTIQASIFTDTIRTTTLYDKFK